MKPLLFKRIFALLVVVALVSVNINLTQTAFADAATNLTAINQKYYSSILLRDCLYGLRDRGTLDKATLDSGSITQPGTSVGVTPIGQVYNSSSKDGNLSCDDTGAILSAVHDAGYKDVETWLTTIGYTVATKPLLKCKNMSGSTPTNCSTVDTPVYTISGPDSMESRMPPQIRAAKYYGYQVIFNNNCQIAESPTGAFTQKQIVEDPAGSKKFVTKDVKVDFPSSTISSGSYSGGGSATISGSTKSITNFDYRGLNTTCGDLLNTLNDLTLAVLQYNSANPDSPLTTSSIASSLTTSATGGATSKPNCTVSDIGWIVCPVMKFTAMLNDGLFGFISEQLQIKLEFFKTDSATYKAWQTFQGLANIIFIIGFIMIVLSQVTSFGISNYGIKKLLPKLIIVAILVNVSYYICQAAIDISNVLGVGIKGIFDTLKPSTDAGAGMDWAGIILGVIAAGAAIIGLLLAVSVPVLFAAFLSLASAALIIFAQKALVILLTALAPIAFAAMLLPNTEKLFKKWRELFTAMLLLFPTVSLLFGAGSLASSILAETAMKSTDPGVQLSMKIAALGAAVLPLLGIIPLLQNALKGTGALGQRLSGMSQAANRRMNNSVRNDSRLGRGVTQALAYRKKQKDVALDRRNARGAMSRRLLSGFGGSGYGQRQQDNAAASERAEYEEGVKAATERQQRDLTHEQKLAAASDHTLPQHERDAAIRYAMANGSFDERAGVLHTVDSMTADQRRSAISGVRAKGDSEIYGSRLLGQLETNRDPRTGLPIYTSPADVEAALDASTTARLAGGSITVPTMARDAYTAAYIQARALADPAARAQAHSDIGEYERENPQAWASISGEVRNATHLGGI